MGHELHSFQMQGPTRYNLEQIRYIHCDSTLYVAVVSGIQPKKTQPFNATGQEEDLLWSVFLPHHGNEMSCVIVHGHKTFRDHDTV